MGSMAGWGVFESSGAGALGARAGSMRLRLPALNAALPAEPQILYTPTPYNFT